MSTQLVAEPQHMQALRKADMIRLARASTRRWIGAGATQSESLMRACEVLQDPPPHMDSMPVHAFLASIRRFGPTRAAKLCSRGRVSELRPLGRLTARESAWLAAHLREIAKPRHARDDPWSGL